MENSYKDILNKALIILNQNQKLFEEMTTGDFKHIKEYINNWRKLTIPTNENQAKEALCSLNCNEIEDFVAML
jgi:hypothetical protein